MKIFKYFIITLVTVMLSAMTITAEISTTDDDDDDEEITKVSLTKKQENIAIISCYTAIGDLEKLKKAVKIGLTDGEMTVNEIKEVMIQLYAYCGFPRSLNALNVLLDVSSTGAYMVGPEGKDLEKNVNKKKIGTRKQTKLVGKKVKGELYQFAPAIDTYLKEHLFADIFSRGILTDQEREVATIAALSVMERVEPQLNAHIQMGKNTGLKQEHIDEISTISQKIKNQ